MFSHLLPVVVAFLPATVSAYGRIGHWLTGEIAHHLLSAPAKEWTNALLPEYDGSLARAALWADEVKPPWSKSHHYVNPPRDCTALSPTNCNCILSAIGNYTTRLADPTTPHPARNEALKFVIHYIGDIHQPLHVSGRFKGGTEMKVLFDSHHTSLHEVWDYLMLERSTKFLGLSRTDYAQHLLSNYPSPTPCPSSSSSFSPSPTLPACPLLWGTESANLNCGLVWANLTIGTDLAHSGYYDVALPALEQGVVAAAYRIATLINAIVEMPHDADPETLLKIQI
ncbi:S1/P1 nuclease [Powellomyces hirtus]|nr:S1/P1 nuclease [Powellomyces hirtus]